uniref:Putative secreted protein n=1 Tax=Ixodes ricinus TaxID=34613 RepID=A0A147BWQ5_IXORI
MFSCVFCNHVCHVQSTCVFFILFWSCGFLLLARGVRTLSSSEQTNLGVVQPPPHARLARDWFSHVVTVFITTLTS